MTILNAHKFDPKILKKYDIRGTYGVDLTQADAFYLGKAFGAYLHKSDSQLEVCIGYDNRESSKLLEKELVEGLSSSGIKVYRLKMVSTPLLYFSTKYICENGIMVTGSHNALTQNGFKMAVNSQPFFDEKIQELASIAENADFVEQNAAEVENIDINDQYISRLISLNNISNKRKIKVVWDHLNGAVSDVLKSVVEQIPGEHIIINESDGMSLTSRSPDPTNRENVDQLILGVKLNDADLGISFDFDGDRVIVVNKFGDLFLGDDLASLMAPYIIKNNGDIVVLDVKTSKSTFDKIRLLGGDAIMCKTGHSFIKKMMLETNAVYGAEVSGHIFFKENYCFDDGLFAALKLLQILSHAKSPIKNILQKNKQKFITEEIRVKCKDTQQIIDSLELFLKESNVHYNDIDGIRVDENDGWWLVRASNTEDVIVFRVEGESTESKNNICEKIFDIIQKISGDLLDLEDFKYQLEHKLL